MTTEALWYVARGTGSVALCLLTVAVVVGVGSRTGRPVFGLPRFAVQVLHRNAALLATVFVGVHVLTLLLDPYAQIRFLAVVVPFAAPYRPAWSGLGTVAFDLFIAVLVTSALRMRLGARVWRAVHWLAYVCWPVAWLHALGTGTDNADAWMRAATVKPAALLR